MGISDTSFFPFSLTWLHSGFVFLVTFFFEVGDQASGFITARRMNQREGRETFKKQKWIEAG